jgi:hypothetical protein
MRDHEAERVFEIPESLPRGRAAFGALPGGDHMYARLVAYVVTRGEGRQWGGDRVPNGIPVDHEGFERDWTLSGDLVEFVVANWDKRHEIFAAILELYSKWTQAMLAIPLLAEVYYRAVLAKSPGEGFPVGHGGLDSLVVGVVGGGEGLADFAGGLVQDHHGVDLKVRAIKQALLTEEWAPDEDAFKALQQAWPEVVADHDKIMSELYADDGAEATAAEKGGDA